MQPQTNDGKLGFQRMDDKRQQQNTNLTSSLLFDDASGLLIIGKLL